VDQFSAAERAAGVTVLFSAHGVPQSYIEAGDPYKRHIQECVQLIEAEYADCEVKTELSYQASHSTYTMFHSIQLICSMLSHRTLYHV
jgi:protoheme ferro-lyase